jgi:hypothetical protein
MKKLRTLFSLLVILLVVTSVVYSQSKETGALKGTVKLEDGSPVPGVLVKIDSDVIVASTKTTITNELGNYRFVGVQPGVYTLTAALEGFATAKQTGVRVSLGKTFTIDLTMKQGTITEEVVVVGKSALVDVKDSSTAGVEMTTEFLQNIPNTQFTVDAVNLAPGVTSDVAYGAADGTGIAYQVDGVDVSDPAGGTAWVFLDYNVVDEVSVSGIGAPAEYGNFSGVVFNTVTKSGTNLFKGYTEFLYQGKDWNSKNSDDPAFAPGKVKFYSIHLDMGGPIIKDKLSFFLSGLYYRQIEQLSGTTYNRDYWQPKGFAKLTWQPSTKTRINTFLEYDIYNGKGRDGSATTEEAATVRQESPEIVGSFSLQHLFSDYTFMEAKLAYFWGYYDLIPNAGPDISGHVDWATGWYTENSSYFYRGDRTRLQANASLTHHADDFIKGSHDFKFGAEFIGTTERDRYGYTNGAYYGDWYGEPYWRIEYEGYDIKADMNTISVYAQDSWTISDRFTINPGVRMDLSWGGVDDLSGDEYKTRPAIAPRIGFTFDVLGDHSTAIKGHWGRYFEGAYIYTVTSLSKAKSDYKEYYWDGSEWVLDYVFPGGNSQYTMADKLNQAYMDQWTIGIERELMKDLSLSATYIWRKNFDHILPLNITGEYARDVYTDSTTGKIFNVWSQTNSRADNIYLITNPKIGDMPWMEFTPYRKYAGIELMLNKRFSNKWQLMASYVYSKAKGNINNNEATGAGYNSTFENPNSQINAEGTLSNDYTHMLKIQGSVILPLDINLNVNFQLISGPTYTMQIRLPSNVDPDKTYIYAEPRGSHRYPTSKNLDVRLEKTVKFGKVKVGLLLDVFNVFNEGIVNWYQTLATNFEEVRGIVNPRAFRAGLRFWF